MDAFLIEKTNKNINGKSSLSNILFQAPQLHFYARIRPTVQKFLEVKPRSDTQDAELIAIPLKIHTWFSSLAWHVYLFQNSCSAWHLDKLKQTSDLKIIVTFTLMTLSYLFKTFSHSVHRQAIGLTGKRHVFCWQWALKWNGNEHQLHVCLFARYRKLLVISPPFIGLSTRLPTWIYPAHFSLYWNEFAF